MDIKLKNKAWLFYLLLIIPAGLLALAICQTFKMYYSIWNFPSMLWAIVFFFAFLLTAIPFLGMARQKKTTLPSDIALLLDLGMILLVLLMFQSEEISITDMAISYFHHQFSTQLLFLLTLLLLPLTYLFLIALCNLVSQCYRHTWIETSLIFRWIRFLGKGKSLRRKFILEILAISAISMVETLILFLTIFELSNTITKNQAALMAALIPIGLETILLACRFANHYSAGAEMSQISTAIAESAQGQFPTENPVSPYSPLYETGESLLELGRLTEEGIRRGIASEKLKVELITNISHDLRTPLTSIIGYGEQLERADLPEDTAATVHALTAKAKYLSAMVNDLFDMAKTASGNITPVKSELNLTRLIEQTLAEMNDAIQISQFVIKTDFTASKATILADGIRLHRVVQNLIDNALKYSLRGTRIFLSTRNEGETIVTSILNTASYEMAFGDVDLTERFTRGDPSRTGEGSGLGLAIAKTYTEAMGGKFDISVHGDSFEAILVFPLTPPTEKLPT